MKKYSIIIIAFLLLFGSESFAQNPQRKSITDKFFPDFNQVENVTPALKKKRGFTDNEEMEDFLNELKKSHPDKISISSIGKSQKKRDIIQVTLSNKDSKDEKTRVWLQGGIHGNEPASTEGMLYLIYELLNNPDYEYLLNRLDIAVVPMANVDGYVKNYRYAHNSLDLNRDQTKLIAPESVSLKKAFAVFNPDVAVDFHEYNPYRRDFAKMSDWGVTSAYDVMFLYSGNLNVPENLRKFTEDTFVSNAKSAMDKSGLRYHDYVTTDTYDGYTHFNQGSSNSRSSATSYALKNVVSTLIEVRGVNIKRTSFKRRIFTTFEIAVSYLKTTYENQNLVKEEIQKAIESKNPVVVRSKKSIYRDTLEMIDLDKEEIKKFEVTIRDALKSKPVLKRERPESYLIDKSRTDLVEKFKALGIEVQILDKDSSFEVEKYVVTDYRRPATKYEQTYLQYVKTKTEKKKINFPAGTFIVKMDQRKANLAAEILEPEAPNSFVHFNVIETDLNKELPIYRKLTKQ